MYFLLIYMISQMVEFLDFLMKNSLKITIRNIMNKSHILYLLLSKISAKNSFFCQNLKIIKNFMQYLGYLIGFFLIVLFFIKLNLFLKKTFYSCKR